MFFETLFRIELLETFLESFADAILAFLYIFCEYFFELIRLVGRLRRIFIGLIDTLIFRLWSLNMFLRALSRIGFRPVR